MAYDALLARLASESLSDDDIATLLDENWEYLSGPYREEVKESEELRRLERRLCQRHLPWFAALWLTVADKRRRTVPLWFNPIQRAYHRARADYNIILKARKIGMTTYLCAEFFHATLFTPNTNTTVIAHNLDTTGEIFERVRRFWRGLPEFLKPKVERNTRREIHLVEAADGTPLDSKVVIGTAGTHDVGRGKDIDNLHLSEFAYFREPGEIMAGAMQALRSDGRVTIESTANGFNAFHDEWTRALRGESRFRPHFFPWHQDPTCRVAVAEGQTLRLSDEEERLRAAYGLDEGQVAWMRLKRSELRERFPQEYPANDAEAFLSATRAVFDAAALSRLLDGPAKEPPVVVEHNGALRIWKEPQPGRLYVAGADCSEGVPDGDFSCCIVLDRETTEQVAELHGRWAPSEFARLCDALGRRFNNALLGVERNNHGHAVLNVLRHDLAYPALYSHRDYDADGRVRPRLGWPTTSKTKPILVSDLADLIARGDLLLHSPEAVRECLTFVYDDGGGTRALLGAYDDRVMALAIAVQMRKVPLHETRMTYLRGA